MRTHPIRYRSYTIQRETPPVPIPEVWVYTHDDWDLDDPRHGWERTLEQAKERIDELEDDQ